MDAVSGMDDSALTTNFYIVVSRGGGWLGISRTIAEQ